MASLDSYLPQRGSAVWRRDRQPEYATESQTIRHVVIRGTEIVQGPSPHVLYRIDVLTEHSHWYICRRYSEFHELHRKLVRRHKIARDLLPPKKLSGNFSSQLINARRQQLEEYLQKIINSEPHVSQSKELLGFLDLPAHNVVQVAEILARQLYTLGDKLLEQATPIALTINDLYCITKRLKLPMDLQYTTEASSDLGHLYSFVHQLKSLKVIPPPPPSSVTKMAFELSLFRSLVILKIDSIPLSQIGELVRVQQQLQKLSAQNCIKSLRELLIDSVEEKRHGAETSQLVESWRLVATAKFTSNRVIIQPWVSLTHLNVSHNRLTSLDDSLQVLPVIKVLNVSNNLLASIDLQHLCLPTLTELILSHNKINNIITRQLVLESIKKLDLSFNELSDLSPLVSFLTLESLNICNNNVTSCDHFIHLSHLKRLTTLTIKDNPIMYSNAARLVLLARFMHKSRVVSVDGMEATNKEQAKIRSLTEKYGGNIDQWPLARRVVPVTQLLQEQQQGVSRDSRQTLPPRSPPSVHVSWSVESITGSNLSDTSPCHSLTTTDDSSIDHPLFFNTTLSFKSTPSSSREDPDGRSDISSRSPDGLTIPTSSPIVLATPPCTPLLTGEDPSSSSCLVTPQMISAALEAVTQAAASTNSYASSPTDSEGLSGILSQALHTFISEHSGVATPPSTPNDSSAHQEEKPLSSTELIAALSAAVSAHIDVVSKNNTPSVPAGTPQEGLSELAKLGIQPEAVLHALNSLSFQNKQEDDSSLAVEECHHSDDEEFLRTITNEDVPFNEKEDEAVPSLRRVSSDPIHRKTYRVIDIYLPIV